MSRIIGALLGFLAILEIIGAFVGPFAFVKTPSLVVAPIYAPNYDAGEIEAVRIRLEQELASLGTHALYPKSLIENFYLERDNATDVFDGSYRSKEEAFELGESLGIDQIAVVSALGYSLRVNLYLTIYDIATEQVVSHTSVTAPDLESLLEWKDLDDEPIRLGEALELEERGLSIGGRLFVGWITALILVSGAILIGWKVPRIILEILLGAGLLLALFSWIYALNGDMDYVQRFVATNGILSIGETKEERTATAVRYLIPLLLLAVLWVSDAWQRFFGIPQRQRGKGLIEVFDVFGPILAMFSAILFALSLPNFLVLEGIPMLAWAAVTPLYLALRRVRFGRGVFLVFLFTGLQSLLINWWQGTFSYVSLPFTVALTLVQYAPFTVLLCFTVRRFRRYGLLAAPFLWVVFDWVRSLGFLGYPWGILGVSQYANPAMIQSAAIGGVWMVSFLPHLSGSVLAIALERFLMEKDIDLRRTWFPPFAVLTGILAVALAGFLTITARSADENGRIVRILALQQNTDPRKHDYQLSFDELSRLTEEAISTDSGRIPDLVAWPESGFVPDVRYWLDDRRSRLRRGKLVRSFLDWQKMMGIPLVTGTQDHFYEPPSPGEAAAFVEDEKDVPHEVKRIRNSAMYLPPNRMSDSDRTYYYKMRLVPFTENFPYREQFPWVAELLHNFSTTQWTPGTEHTVFQAPAFRFSTPICFEDVFPNHVREYVRSGAEVLVNMSNDYWANTPLEGFQHAAHAVFRTVENRRPLVRSTCSGWTISVDTEGRIDSGWPPFYTPGWIIAEHSIPEVSETTLYTQWGDWFPVLCILIWAGLLSTDFMKTRKRVKPPSTIDTIHTTV
ncbi:MAG: apolipoprotein N-acyltransferase [Spirochaetaceae bacterium]|nr:apolipoprotein N-acyltransferase [Spirochaetaceae bacterium]